MLPQAGGFVPVNMFDQNGKLGMSVTGSAKEATDHVPCEVVYPNGVVLRIQRNCLWSAPFVNPLMSVAHVQPQ